MALLRLSGGGEKDEGKEISHLIGWMNSSDLWDPSVSCNEFITHQTMTQTNYGLGGVGGWESEIHWHAMFNAVRYLHCIIKNSSHIQHYVMELLCLMEAVNKSCHSSSQECIARFNHYTSRMLPYSFFSSLINAIFVQILDEDGMAQCC